MTLAATATREDRFTFGLWTVGWRGATRSARRPASRWTRSTRWTGSPSWARGA